jgi:hypothetical protein
MMSLKFFMAAPVSRRRCRRRGGKGFRERESSQAVAAGVGQFLIEVLIHLALVFRQGEVRAARPAAQMHGGSDAVKFQASAAAPAIPFQVPNGLHGMSRNEY